jgi:hypothetical protein
MNEARKVPKTGLYRVRKGDRVIPAGKMKSMRKSKMRMKSRR